MGSISSIFEPQHFIEYLGLPSWRSVKNLLGNAEDKRCGFDLWVGKIPWSRKWQPTPVFSSGKLHEQKSLVDYSPGGLKESDTTESANTQMIKNWLSKNT